MNNQHAMICGCVVMVAMLLLGCMSSQAAPEESQTNSKPSSAEESGWKLAFHDTFDRQEIGENWKVVDGSWQLQDNCLRGSGAIVSTQGFPAQPPAGFQRLEFEAKTDIRPLKLLGDAPPVVIPSDIDSFIHAQSFEAADGKVMNSGYFFQFGGNNNTINRIRRKAELVWEEANPPTTIKLDHWHRIVVENDQGVLRFHVDGKLLHEEKQSSFIMGVGQDHVGFYFHSAAMIRDVKVYVKRPPDDLDLD